MLQTTTSLVWLLSKLRPAITNSKKVALKMDELINTHGLEEFDDTAAKWHN